MRRLVALALLMMSPLGASATTIHFEAVDVPDTVIGEDLWEYRYRVEDFTFDEGFGFSIFFDHVSFTKLASAPEAPNASWDVLTLQPDLSLPDDGLYDALSVANPATLEDPFTISFVWLGQEAPGAQPFVIYEPGFATLETGTTVPEPTTTLLIAIGLLFMNRRRSCG